MSWKSQWYQFWLILMFLLKVKILRPVIGLTNLIEISLRKQLCILWTGKTARKTYLTRKNVAVLIAVNIVLHKIQKFLQMRIWHPCMSQLPTPAESWSAVSFMVASWEMALSESKFWEKDRLMKIFHIDKLHGLFLTLILVMQMMRMTFLDASQVVNDSVQSNY